MRPSVVHSREIQDRPVGYAGPNLDPTGLTLTPEQLGRGVYALVAAPPPKDNGGVIVGSRSALVVDAGVNEEIARLIQRIATDLSSVPVRYLANTTYHGDHTFGNAAFSDDVIILSSYQNRVSMTDLEGEKRIRSGNMYGNDAAFRNVTVWRKPDITFERFLCVDLGDQEVELWHFGPGNAPGDTIVYAPGAQVAWTGNFLGHAGVAPMLLEGSPEPYIRSLDAMKETLDVETIVPGHGPLGPARPAIDWMIAYNQWLLEAVRKRITAGDSEAEAIEQVAPPDMLSVPPGAPPQLARLNVNMHRLDVMATYRALAAERKP
jgi:cyclase